jgi:membrane associated rhomboid family serine protease
MFKKQNIVVKLVIINVAVFLLINLIRVFLYLFKAELFFDKIIEFLAVPSSIKMLMFRIWTPITYMFLHEDFFHILGNMLWLFFLGNMLIRYIKDIDFLSIYILGGLSGALVYVLAFNIFPVFSDIKIFSVALGASASVTAIVITMATYKPMEEVYFWGILKIKLFIIALIMIIYDVFLLKSDNAGGHFAHIGGAIYGFAYGYYLKKGKKIAKWFTEFLSKVISFDFKPKPKLKVIKNNLQTKDDFKYNYTKQEIKNEIDRILTKISFHGYQSLTKKEKDFLTTHGKNYS